jgi:hypothetical protein
MMGTKGRLATILIAITFFGCKGPVQTSAASSGDGGSGGSSGGGILAAAFGGGTRSENVMDTTMNNMVAFSVTVPANWKFQGTLFQGGLETCDSNAFGVWRASSPDGKSMIEQLPVMLWAYGTGPKPTTGCLPINGPVPAQNLLRMVAKQMNLGGVSDEQVPASDVAEAQKYAAPGSTPDLAQGMVHYQKDSVAMQGRLKVSVDCAERNFPGFHSILRGMPDRPATSTDRCTGAVLFMAAPEGQLAAVTRLWAPPAMGPHTNNDWGWAWVKRKADQGNQMNGAMIAGADARFKAQHDAIARTMQMQQQMHDQFLQTMQDSTNGSIANANASMNARTTAASDMVDYSLNRQTVMDTTTGTIYKVPNQVTVGGSLQQVHGNGQP